MSQVLDIGGSSSSLTWQAPEFLSGTKNGVNKTFTLSRAPFADSLSIDLNGVQQYLGADFSLSGNEVTFVTAPSAEATIIGHYQYAS